MWMIPTASALPDYVCLQSSKQSFRSLHIKASLAGACKAPSCCLCLPSLSWLIVPEFCWDHSLGPPVLCLRSGMAGLLAQATPVSFSDHLYHKSHFSRTKIQDKHPQANVKSLCGSHLRIKVAFLVRAVQRKFSSVQLSCIQPFVTPWTTACQASLSINNCQSLHKPMSIELVMSSNHLILCHPLFLLRQSFPALESFQMSQLFTSGGQSIKVSASTSVLQVNTQDWSLLGWTGWISLQSKGLSRVFSNTAVQKHQFFGAQLSL